MYEGLKMIEEALKLAADIDGYAPDNNISEMLRRLVAYIQELEK